MAAAIRAVKGVQGVTLNAGNSEATVVRKAGVGSDKDLEKAVRDAGYGAWLIPVKTIEIKVDGLSCSGCEERASSTPQGVKGTRKVKVKVSKANKSATVTYEVKSTSPTKIVWAHKKAGFPARKSS